MVLHSQGQAWPAKSGTEDRRRYWPLEWTRAACSLGYSAADLDLLGRLGGELFWAAGVSAQDVVANLVPAAPGRDYLQLVLGSREAGLSSVQLGSGSEVGEIDVFAPMWWSRSPKNW